MDNGKWRREDGSGCAEEEIACQSGDLRQVAARRVPQALRPQACREGSAGPDVPRHRRIGGDAEARGLLQPDDGER